MSVAFNPVTLKEEDAEAIRQAQNTSMYTDPSMMAATLGMAQAEAMKNAASNPNGAMMGFMGMNMASGGMNIQGLYDQGSRSEAGAARAAGTKRAESGKWTESTGR